MQTHLIRHFAVEGFLVEERAELAEEFHGVGTGHGSLVAGHSGHDFEYQYERSPGFSREGLQVLFPRASRRECEIPRRGRRGSNLSQWSHGALAVVFGRCCAARPAVAPYLQAENFLNDNALLFTPNRVWKTRCVGRRLGDLCAIKKPQLPVPFGVSCLLLLPVFLLNSSAGC